jgi:pimeloyl-ACP methyl ester carboxylesterase
MTSANSDLRDPQPHDHDHRAPSWFRAALEDTPIVDEVPVDGTAVSCRTWGPRGAPGILLVHGGAAHARWWDHLGPLLAQGGRHRVGALDLSGHGDSGTRGTYGLQAWAEEVMAVASHLGMDRPPVVVGHSMGGFVAMHAAAQYGDRLAGAIIVDSPVRRPDPESQEGRSGRDVPPSEDLSGRSSTAVAAVLPGAGRSHDPPYLHRRHVGRHERAGDASRASGRWKFDPMVFGRVGQRQPEDVGEICSRRVRCRIAVVHAERSEIVDDRRHRLHVRAARSERAVRGDPAGAYHHLILDQPLAFVSAVRALLADWEHSIPRRIPGVPDGVDTPP